MQAMQRMGFSCAEVDDPYAAMLELARRPVAYRAVILSLAGVYKEELAVIAALRRRYPQIEVWLTHTDSRAALLAEAMRLGADGLLSEDGLHRVAIAAQPTSGYEPAMRVISAPVNVPVPAIEQADEATADDLATGEPVLTAEELRALLDEQPAPPVSEPSERM